MARRLKCGRVDGHKPRPCLLRTRLSAQGHFRVASRKLEIVTPLRSGMKTMTKEIPLRQVEVGLVLHRHHLATSAPWKGLLLFDRSGLVDSFLRCPRLLVVFRLKRHLRDPVTTDHGCRLPIAPPRGECECRTFGLRRRLVERASTARLHPHFLRRLSFHLRTVCAASCRTERASLTGRRRRAMKLLMWMRAGGHRGMDL